MKLSVCVPTWNRRELLTASLRCTAEQIVSAELFSQVEICISDNGSDDGTADAINQIRSEFDRVQFRVHRFDLNMGYARNMDAVIRHATGEFVFLNGDDDRFEADGLRRLLEQCDTADASVIVLRNLWNFHGSLDWSRVGDGERIIFSDVAECVERLGPFHLSFIGNFILRRQAYLDCFQARYLDSIYPHTAVLFDVLRSQPVEFRNFACVEVDDTCRRLGPTAARGTAIDMARIQTDGYLADFGKSRSCLGRYIIFLRSLPRAVLYERVGICASDGNQYQSTSIKNVRECYRASSGARIAAIAMWFIARYFPVRLVELLLRERVRSL